MRKLLKPTAICSGLIRLPVANIREKDLVFNFPGEWEFTKYDDSLHHTQRLNKVQGFQAVDLVAMPLRDEIVLLEVKDFRRGIDIGGRCQDYQSYLSEVANKVLNTVAGLFTAYRLKDELLGKFAARLLQRDGRIHAVFFLEELPLETVQRTQAAFLNARNQLIGMLNNLGFEVEVYSLNNLPSKHPWSVTDLYTPPPAAPTSAKK